jgi:hypothetical protein
MINKDDTYKNLFCTYETFKNLIDQGDVFSTLRKEDNYHYTYDDIYGDVS